MVDVSESDMPFEDQQREIERDGSAPEVPSTGTGGGEEDYLYLPGLISDEFGISRSQVNMELALGNVTLDGEKVDPVGGSSIKRSEAAGKLLEIKGGNFRTFRMQIPAV